MWSNSSGEAKSQKQRPYSKSRPISLLERLHLQFRTHQRPILLYWHPRRHCVVCSKESVQGRGVEAPRVSRSPKGAASATEPVPSSNSIPPQADPEVDFVPTPSNPRRTRRHHSEDSESEEAEKGSKKQHRCSVNEVLFPWKGASAVLRAKLEPKVQQWLNFLDDSVGHRTLPFVARKILLCPPEDIQTFPFIVKGCPVNLAKVLGSSLHL